MPDKNLKTLAEKTSLTPAELIKIHVSNPNHVVTDDELKNLLVGDDAIDKEELIKEIKEKEAEVDCHNHDNNPYDILDA